MSKILKKVPKLKIIRPYDFDKTRASLHAYRIDKVPLRTVNGKLKSIPEEHKKAVKMLYRRTLKNIKQNYHWDHGEWVIRVSDIRNKYIENSKTRNIVEINKLFQDGLKYLEQEKCVRPSIPASIPGGVAWNRYPYRLNTNNREVDPKLVRPPAPHNNSVWYDIVNECRTFVGLKPWKFNIPQGVKRRI